MSKKTADSKTQSGSLGKIETLFYALVALVPLAYCSRLASPTNAKLPVICVLVGCTLLICLIRLSYARNLPKTPLLYPVAAYLAWKVISAIYGSHLYASLVPLIQAFIYCGVFVGIFGTIRKSEQVRRVLFAASVATLPVCLVGLMEAFGLRLPSSLDIFSGRIYSTMGNPTFLAAYLGLLFPVQLSLLIIGPSRWRWLLGVSAALSCVCIVLTFTRGIWLGTAAALPAMIWMVAAGGGKEMLRGKARPIALAVPAILVLSASAFILSPVEDSSAGETESVRIGVRSSDTLRKSLIVAGARMFGDHALLGVGLGGYQVHYLDYIRTKPIKGYYHLSHDYAHNDVVHTAAEEGIVGVGIYLWGVIAVCCAVVSGLRRAKARGDMERAFLIAGIAAGFVAFSGDLMANVGIRQTHIGVFFWMILGLLAVLTQTSEPKSEMKPESSRPRWIGITAPMLGLIFAVGMSVVGVRAVMSDAQTYQAALLASKGDWQSAIAANENALKLNPYAQLPLYWLGIAYREAGYAEDSLRHLTDFQEKYPHSNRIDFETGATMFALGDAAGSVAGFEDAISRDPQDFPAWQGLAAASYVIGDEAEALQAAARAVRLGSDQAASRHYGAPALRRSPGAASYAVAAPLIRVGIYDKALPLVTEALHLEPGNVEYLTTLGAVYLRLGNLAEAEQALSKAAGADVQSPDVHGYLAMVYAQTGRTDAARRELERAISLSDDEARRQVFESMLQSLQ